MTVDAPIPAPRPDANDTYLIGDPGRAAATIGAGVPCGVPGWPDITADTAAVAGLDLRAASVRGVMHRRFGTPRQDSYSIVWQEDTQTLITTVCDGLGSFDRSHEAAHLAATRLPDLADSGWRQAFEGVSAEILAVGSPMATTAVCARISTAGDGSHRGELAWVGDSAAYLLGAAGWQCLTDNIKMIGDGDIPLSSVTAALPAEPVEINTLEVEFGPGEALFLMTDGVADPLGGGTGEVGRLLAQWWARPPSEHRFAAQVGFARRSFDDDRTVVGIWASLPGEP